MSNANPDQPQPPYGQPPSANPGPAPQWDHPHNPYGNDPYGPYGRPAYDDQQPYTQQPYGQTYGQSPQNPYAPYGQAPQSPYSPYAPQGPQPYAQPLYPRPARKTGMPGWAIALIAVVVAIVLIVATVFGGIALGRYITGQAVSGSHSQANSKTGDPNAVPTPSARPDSVDKAFDKYYTQSLTWKDCAQGDNCATLTAPSDWSDATSSPIDLHIAIHWAEGKSQGTLFINPGGPGASGADYLQDFIDYTATDDLLDNYDIIGFDPRGIGDSTPIVCGDDMDLLNDWFLSPPATESNLDQIKQTAATYAKACKDGNPDTVDHVDTQSVARDLDMMRALMGSDKLDYLGFSYGTYIGSTYAAIFPAQVGRLVLDGAIDPNEDQSESLVNQAVGFENALKTYLKDCMKGSDCPFTGSVDDATAQIQGWLKQYDDKPMDVGGEKLNGTALMLGIITPLYNQDNWQYLTMAFQELKNGKGDTFMFLADTYLERDPSGKYTSNSMEANSIVNCLDDPPTSDMAKQKELAARLAKESPTFGRYMAYGNIGCDALALDRSGIKKLDWSAKGADPILVVGTTGDPATPYDAAVSLAKTLDSGTLLTYKGEGHTAYGRENDCVAKIVDTYLVDGGVPEDGATCG